MNDSALVQAREGQDVFGVAHDSDFFELIVGGHAQPNIVACLSPAGQKADKMVFIRHAE
jgi:hypothetical protein